MPANDSQLVLHTHTSLFLFPFACPEMEAASDMTDANLLVPRRFRDLTIEQDYVRASPFKCVLSNRTHDILVHTIFVISASTFFEARYECNNGLQYRVQPDGPSYPKLVVDFETSEIEMFLEFAYNRRLQVKSAEDLAVKCEMAFYLLSPDMYNQLERIACDQVDIIHSDHLVDYLGVAKKLKFKRLEKMLTNRFVSLNNASLNSVIRFQWSRCHWFTLMVLAFSHLVVIVCILF